MWMVGLLAILISLSACASKASQDLIQERCAEVPGSEDSVPKISAEEAHQIAEAWRVRYEILRKPIGTSNYQCTRDVGENLWVVRYTQYAPRGEDRPASIYVSATTGKVLFLAVGSGVWTAPEAVALECDSSSTCQLKTNATLGVPLAPWCGTACQLSINQSLGFAAVNAPEGKGSS
jgi:hypothetical protein